MSERAEDKLLDEIDVSGEPVLTFQDHFGIEDLGTCEHEGETYTIMLNRECDADAEAYECAEAWIKMERFLGFRRVEMKYIIREGYQRPSMCAPGWLKVKQAKQAEQANQRLG